MTITIHQPNFMPWLGYFHKMAQSERFIILDNVQFIRDGFFHRTRIRTQSDWMWLTVPCHNKFSEKPLINEIRIDYSQKWVHKHLQSIKTYYGKAPFFQENFSFIDEILNKKFEYLVDLNLAIIEQYAKYLEIYVPIIKASTLPVEGHSSDLLLSICKQQLADKYLAGPSGRKYMDLDKFQKGTVEVEFHYFNHPHYKQMHPGFEPFMSILDLFMLYGKKSSSILNLKENILQLPQDRMDKEDV